ncbi:MULTISPECIES: hypothetical protein [unclassified Helicobacter]|nr:MULTISPECIES: hypothetical protein [unclassified Helicobacter]
MGLARCAWFVRSSVWLKVVARVAQILVKLINFGKPHKKASQNRAN